MKKTILIAIVALVALSCDCNKPTTNVKLFETSAFDTTLNGQAVSIYTLTNANGMAAQVTNFGARLVDLWVPAADGTFKDVVWGYETIAAYLNSTDKFCGPIVGRYGNRIGKGAFAIGDQKYQLTINNGENHLHGGTDGFWNKVWSAQMICDSVGGQALELSLVSPDGDQGYPGNVTIIVTYSLNNDNELKIAYSAITDKATIINPTSHAYFNLHGTSLNSTNSHILTLNADNYTPTDMGLIPTGEIAAVEGTPLDFRTPTAIGDRVDADFEALAFGKGYDHNWVLNKADSSKSVTLAAEVYEPATGVKMQVLTDQPALQFYSGNFMDGLDTGKNGDPHNFRTGIALEAQNYPDAPNHSNFPSSLLMPGEEYTQTTIYKFLVIPAETK